ncbi:hypothetical protein JCM10296v2_001695 [Rhodotorula toruloides]
MCTTRWLCLHHWYRFSIVAPFAHFARRREVEDQAALRRSQRSLCFERGLSAAYDRIGPGYGSRVTSSKLRSVSTPVHQHPTTASYQPPAPAFNPNDPLRLPTLGTSTVSGVDASFIQESTARLSLGPDPTAGGAGQSGYDKAVKAGHASSSTRPPKMDGSAMGAGMHGLQRSFDAFKLDTRFAAHKVGKKISRKLNSVL